MTIIKIDPLESGLRPIESQSHRCAVWLEGYIEVPAHLESAAWATGGFCTLTIEDGKLVGIEALPMPEPEPVEPVMTTEEATLDMLADINYRLGLLELGGQEVKV